MCTFCVPTSEHRSQIDSGYCFAFMLLAHQGVMQPAYDRIVSSCMSQHAYDRIYAVLLHSVPSALQTRCGLRWRPRLAQWCHLANDDEADGGDQG